jgi:hypothetical protein
MTGTTSAERTASLRKVYGRGFYDGVRSAGAHNSGDAMQAAKMERIEKSVSGIARKVLDAVPVSEPWPASKIIGEMVRMTSSSPDFKIVMGCLSTLADQGLVREPKKGEFQRVKPRPALSAVSTPDGLAEEPTEPTEPTKLADDLPLAPAEPMDRLASLAGTLRELSAKVTAMAKEVEDVALSVEERIQRIHADTEKLRQLQSLLKSIGQ